MQTRYMSVLARRSGGFIVQEVNTTIHKFNPIVGLRVIIFAIQKTIVNTSYIMSVLARHGGVSQGILFYTFDIAWVVFSHVCTRV